MRHLKTIALLLLIAALLLFTQLNLSPDGIGFTAGRRTLNRLKNRAQPPSESDFDDRVTLAGLLQPGDDRARWAERSACRIEGFVVSVRDGSVESANSYSLFRRDTHISIALRKDAPPRERVEVEVTPRTREWARRLGRDWSTGALKGELEGRWCRFEGWMLFDVGHDGEAENTNPGGLKNWRATAWEIHPVTSVEVVGQH